MAIVARILAFTDPHGERPAARAILELARREKPDLVLCAGDISVFGNGHEPFLRDLGDLGQDVLFVPGNHESPDDARQMELRFPFMKDVTFKTVEAAGVRIAGLTGADRAFWPGGRADAGMVSNAEILWGALDRAKPLVLMSHYPPFRTAISGVTYLTPDSGGSMTVRRIVEKLEPALFISGHYHQDFGKEDRLGPTRLVNPGPNGMILEA